MPWPRPRLAQPALLWADTSRILGLPRVASNAEGRPWSSSSSSDGDETSQVSPLVLIVPPSAVGAPRVFQSFRAGIRWGVGSPLLDISPSDDPSIVSDASMERKLRMITSLLSRQNLLQAAPTHLVITLIPPTALLPVISSGLIGIVPHVYLSFRCPPFPSSTRPCSGQDNSLSLYSTVLHRMALEGTAAGRESQRGTTAIGCFRGPG